MHKIDIIFAMIDEKTILAVDDMPEVLVTINEILGEEYDLRLVKSAAAAMTLLYNEKVDLIILDIDMPVLSGFDFQEFVKHKEETANIPVLFITSITNPDLVSKAKTSGAMGFISKPFNADELRLQVSQAFVV
ncbi:MAG: response regulator [Spirochaetaceae bacterium]|nr:response regulator [Spirochaetaceae bacterium]GMO21795.1 MAG: hypothetical protein Pg6A_09110 [Termitinemataceae bacterium]